MDQTITDKGILKKFEKRRNKFDMTCIDYMRTNIMVQHKWIVKCLKIFVNVFNISKNSTVIRAKTQTNQSLFMRNFKLFRKTRNYTVSLVQKTYIL